MHWGWEEMLVLLKCTHCTSEILSTEQPPGGLQAAGCPAGSKAAPGGCCSPQPPPAPGRGCHAACRCAAQLPGWTALRPAAAAAAPPHRPRLLLRLPLHPQAPPRLLSRARHHPPARPSGRPCPTSGAAAPPPHPGCSAAGWPGACSGPVSRWRWGRPQSHRCWPAAGLRPSRKWLKHFPALPPWRVAAAARRGRRSAAPGLPRP